MLTLTTSGLLWRLSECTYLEATTNGSIEVRDLAENGLVSFPLAVTTGNREVREHSSLEEPSKSSVREMDSEGRFKTAKSSVRT